MGGLENTNESILPVCDKPYHKIKENLPHSEELEKLWNYALCAREVHLTPTNETKSIQWVVYMAYVAVMVG